MPSPTTPNVCKRTHSVSRYPSSIATIACRRVVLNVHDWTAWQDEDDIAGALGLAAGQLTSQLKVTTLVGVSAQQLAYLIRGCHPDFTTINLNSIGGDGLQYFKDKLNRMPKNKNKYELQKTMGDFADSYHKRLLILLQLGWDLYFRQ